MCVALRQEWQVFHSNLTECISDTTMTFRGQGHRLDWPAQGRAQGHMDSRYARNNSGLIPCGCNIPLSFGMMAICWTKGQIPLLKSVARSCFTFWQLRGPNSSSFSRSVLKLWSVTISPSCFVLTFDVCKYRENDQSCGWYWKHSFITMHYYVVTDRGHPSA